LDERGRDAWDIVFETDSDRGAKVKSFESLVVVPTHLRVFSDPDRLLNQHMYLAYEIEKTSREKLLVQFPPKYPDVICHHVTLQFPASADSQLPDWPGKCEVIGYADSGDGLEVLVVEIDGNAIRPDGQLFHVTHSLDRSKGKKPFHSNELIRSTFILLPAPEAFLAAPSLISEIK
jgi:hypothetical protein